MKPELFTAPCRCSSKVSRSLSMSARAFAQLQIVRTDLCYNRNRNRKTKKIRKWKREKSEMKRERERDKSRREERERCPKKSKKQRDIEEKGGMYSYVFSVITVALHLQIIFFEKFVNIHYHHSSVCILCRCSHLLFSSSESLSSPGGSAFQVLSLSVVLLGIERITDILFLKSELIQNTLFWWRILCFDQRVQYAVRCVQFLLLDMSCVVQCFEVMFYHNITRSRTTKVKGHRRSKIDDYHYLAVVIPLVIQLFSRMHPLSTLPNKLMNCWQCRYF